MLLTFYNIQMREPLIINIVNPAKTKSRQTMSASKEIERQDDLLRLIRASDESRLFGRRDIDPSSGIGETFHFEDATTFQRRVDEPANQWINEYDQISRHHPNTHQTNESMHFYGVPYPIANECNESREADLDEDMASAARNLLRELEQDTDIKLSSSNFVAFLRSLAGASSTPPAATETLKEDPASTEWDEWNSVSRDWNFNSTSGYGYAGFAERSSDYFFHDHMMTSDPDTVLLRMVELERTLSSSHPNHDVWWELGKLNSMYGDDTNALAAFSKAIEHNRDALLDYASSCINLSLSQDAINAVKRWYFGEETTVDCTTSELLQLIQKRQCGQRGSLAMGLLYLIDSNFEMALQTFESLLNTSTSDPIDASENLNRIGAMRANLGDYNRALDFYEKAIAASQHPNSYLKVFENVAISHFCVGETQNAQQWIERVSKCDGRTKASKQSAIEIRNVICSDHQ